MAYTYGDFGKWELDEDEGILESVPTVVEIGEEAARPRSI